MRERISHVLDDDPDSLEIGLLAGLGLEYGDIPGGTMVTSKIH